jgi:hypothetical protein
LKNVQLGKLSIKDIQRKHGTGGDVVKETADFFGVPEATVKADLYKRLYGPPAGSPAPDQAESDPPTPTPPAKPNNNHWQRAAMPKTLQCADKASNLNSRPIAAGIKIAAAEGETAGPPKFEMTGYTGGPMMLDNFDDPVVVDLDTLIVASEQTPILWSHDDQVPLGHADQIRFDRTGIYVPAGKGFFSAANEKRDEVINSARQGYPWQASIGGRSETVEFYAAGETVDVNGQTFEGPINVARRMLLREISILSLGADYKTSASLTARLCKGTAMPGLEEFIKSMGFDPTTLSPEQMQAFTNMYQSQQAATQAGEKEGESGNGEPPADKKGDEESTEAKNKANNLRAAASTQQLRAEYATEMRKMSAIRKVCGDNEELAAKAIESGWDLERTKIEVELVTLRAGRSQGVAAGMLGRPAGHPDIGAVIECSMLLRKGDIKEDQLAKLDKRRYTADVIDAAVSGENRGYTLSRAFNEYLWAHGRQMSSGGITDATIDAVRRIAVREIQAEPGSGGPSLSTISLPNILSNLLNKSLLASFYDVPTASDKFCGTQDLNDFKTATRLRLSAEGDLEIVGKSGELHDQTLGEENWTNQLQTYGKKLSLSRQDLINDDLDAFAAIPKLIGRKAAIKIEKLVFIQLLANAVTDGSNNFFSAGHNNYLSGSNSALSISALTSAVPLFLKQVDKQGDPIVLAPAILLVPAELMVLADQLYTDTNPVVPLAYSKGCVKNARKYDVFSAIAPNTTRRGRMVSVPFTVL